MTLSEYEEMVVAELEAQFSGRTPGPGLNWGRLAAPAACLLGGVALLVAAHHGALLIRLSDLLGFPTAGITTALSLAGFSVLLGCAFLLGHTVRGVRPVPAEAAGTERPVRPAGRR
jgi:hypothetical protein